MQTPKKSKFYTLKGYRLLSRVKLTESMEDYVEMICRLSAQSGRVRVNDLARQIHVSPSSASKMVSKLEALDLVRCPRYGAIELTPKGSRLGAYLIWRHKTLERFLRLLNGTPDETRQTEQIEHYVNRRTMRNIRKLVDHLEKSGWGRGDETP